MEPTSILLENVDNEKIGKKTFCLDDNDSNVVGFTRESLTFIFLSIEKPLFCLYHK